MQILRVSGIRKRFAVEPVLDGVTFDLFAGDRVGLVGPNGTGKTTLLKIIAGSEEADAGTLSAANDIRVGYLEQHPSFPPGRTLWEEAESALAHFVGLQREAEELGHRLAECHDPVQQRRLTDRLDRIQHELHRHDAYRLEHKIERVLDGLGFPTAMYQTEVVTLSGGEQNRLILAKLLLAEPDLMLLDEPSNHLDVDATAWLEDFLAHHTAAMIIVSHDRYFLDRVTNRTFELFQGTVDVYRGNFTAYTRQKEDRLLVERRTYQKQQESIAKAEDFIRRHHYGQKSAQAEDRRKKLARIERVAPPREITPPPMAFPPAERSGDVVLQVKSLTKTYDKPLFAEMTFDIARGERWGILGPNGCGKTTLLRCLLRQEQPDEGEVVCGHNVVLGYFDQHLSTLDENVPAVDAILPSQTIPDELVEQHRRDLLARFGLTGDRALQPVGNLSGGERCRVALARLSAAKANFLVLDEPTNHLDLWARDALEGALRAFDGTILFVSHDRYFIDQVADHLLVFESPERSGDEPRVRIVHGNYTTYRHLQERDSQRDNDRAGSEGETRQAVQAAKAETAAATATEKRTQRRRQFPYRKVADLEAEIEAMEAEIESLHEQLADPDTQRDGDRVRELNSLLARCEEELQRLYEHWEEAVELN